MAIKFAEDVRTAMAGSIEAVLGTAPKLRLLTGDVEANVAAAETGTLLAELTLPSDWLANAASGAVAKTATDWTGVGATGITTANAGHFRLCTSAGVAKMQGTVTATGGGGDLTLNNISIADGQAITISGFTLTVGNA